METVIDWRPFCDQPLYRSKKYSLDRAWLDENGKGYATDGTVAVEINDTAGLEPPSGRVPRVSDVLGNFATEGFREMPEIEGPPKGADPWWNTGHECANCSGSGTDECSCCGRSGCCECCDGSGWCSGKQWPTTGCYLDVACKAEVYGVEFNRRYAWIVSKLPGVKVFVNNDEAMLDFIFDGGRGRLMGFAKGR